MFSHQWWRTGLASACLLFVVASPAGQETRADTPTVRLATVDWPPFYSSDLPEGGPIARVTRAAFAREGYDTKIEFTAWKRTLKLVKAQRVDFMMGAYITPDRKERFRFTRPIAETRDVIIAHKRTGVTRYEALTDLAGYRIGIGRGWDFGEALEAVRDSLTLVPAPDTATLVRQISRNRIDMLIETEAVARTTVQRSDSADMDNLVVLEPPFRRAKLAHGIARDHSAAGKLVGAFNAGFAALKRDGTLQDLMPPSRFNLAP